MKFLDVLIWSKKNEKEVFNLLKNNIHKYVTVNNQYVMLNWSISNDEDETTDLLVKTIGIENIKLHPLLAEVLLRNNKRVDLLNNMIDCDINKTLFNNVSTNLDCSLDIFNKMVDHGLYKSKCVIYVNHNMIHAMNNNKDFFDILGLILEECRHNTNVYINIYGLVSKAYEGITTKVYDDKYDQEYHTYKVSNANICKLISTLLKFFTVNDFIKGQFKCPFEKTRNILNQKMLVQLLSLGFPIQYFKDNSAYILNNLIKLNNKKSFKYMLKVLSPDVFMRDTYRSSIIYKNKNIKFLRLISKVYDLKHAIQYNLDECAQNSNWESFKFLLNFTAPTDIYKCLKFCETRKQTRLKIIEIIINRKDITPESLDTIVPISSDSDYALFKEKGFTFIDGYNDMLIPLKVQSMINQYKESVKSSKSYFEDSLYIERFMALLYKEGLSNEDIMHIGRIVHKQYVLET